METGDPGFDPFAMPRELQRFFAAEMYSGVKTLDAEFTTANASQTLRLERTGPRKRPRTRDRSDRRAARR